MTNTELGETVMRVRKLFGAPIDEEIWSLARKWIAELDYSVCRSALDAYALDFGGSAGKFIPSKFRDYVDAVVTRQSEERRRGKEDATRRAQLAIGSEKSRIEFEWLTLRTEIRTADRERVEDAIAFLVSIGWRRPDSGDPSSWSRSWVVAISDLLAGRDPLGIPARTFYSRAVPPERLRTP